MARPIARRSRLLASTTRGPMIRQWVLAASFAARSDVLGGAFRHSCATTLNRQPPEHPAFNRLSGLPADLRALLEAADEAAENAAWSAFLDSYSRLILYIARRSCSTRDAAMDRYAFVLGQLRENGYRRLRAYEVDDRANFTTWLAVVVRRLCTDFHRRAYGRASDGSSTPGDAQRDARRRLVDLVAEAVDVDALADHREDPEGTVRRVELEEALARAVRELESGDQLLLAMRFVDASSARVIADTLGYPSPFHVYRRLNKVLAALRVRLEEHGFAGPQP